MKSIKLKQLADLSEKANADSVNLFDIPYQKYGFDFRYADGSYQTKGGQTVSKKDGDDFIIQAFIKDNPKINKVTIDQPGGIKLIRPDGSIWDLNEMNILLIVTFCAQALSVLGYLIA